MCCGYCIARWEGINNLDLICNLVDSTRLCDASRREILDRLMADRLSRRRSSAGTSTAGVVPPGIGSSGSERADTLGPRRERVLQMLRDRRHGAITSPNAGTGRLLHQCAPCTALCLISGSRVLQHVGI